MKRSRWLVALVPPTSATFTSTVPAPEPAGETTSICVGESTSTSLAITDPNVTVEEAVKPVPVTTTAVPPVTGPSPGATPLTVGTGTYENRSAGLVALVPPAPDTVTSTVPAPAGARTLICVGESTSTFATGTTSEPNLTVEEAAKPVPVTVTSVARANGPSSGVTPLTLGAGTYVNRSAGLVALVPPRPDTLTSTVPAPAGACTLICVGE